MSTPKEHISDEHSKGHKGPTLIGSLVLTGFTLYGGIEYSKHHVLPHLPPKVQNGIHSMSARASQTVIQTTAAKHLTDFIRQLPRPVQKYLPLAMVGIGVANEIDHIKHRAHQVKDSFIKNVENFKPEPPNPFNH